MRDLARHLPILSRLTGQARGLARRAGPALSRALVIGLVVATPLWAGESAAGTDRFDRGLRWTAREHAFSLSSWEVSALADLVSRSVAPAVKPGADPATDRAAVERYCALTGELGSLNAERDRLAATAGAGATESPTLLARAESLRAERQTLVPRVEAIVSYQLEQVLAEQNIRAGWIESRPVAGSPLPRLTLTPGVAFHLGPTPDLLVVAPRDRIQVVGSALLSPDLSFDQVDRVEADGDRLGYSSLVTEIGGLAAYPSMVPASSSLNWTLQTIAHEWLHHYLAFRPLGQGYFSDYQMRSLNETVADLGGAELGSLVYQRYYAPASPPAPAAQSGAAPASGPSFGDLMRETRAEVERYLARGDVAGAEKYMADRRAALAAQGYYVRKLNTAYLSFFGAYAGSDNPFEPKLRALRERSGTLAGFLEAVSRFTSPADLDAKSTAP
jgi:hypothetical protein